MNFVKLVKVLQKNYILVQTSNNLYKSRDAFASCDWKLSILKC